MIDAMARFLRVHPVESLLLMLAALTLMSGLATCLDAKFRKRKGPDDPANQRRP